MESIFAGPPVRQPGTMAGRPSLRLARKTASPAHKAGRRQEATANCPGSGWTKGPTASGAKRSAGVRLARCSAAANNQSTTSCSPGWARRLRQLFVSSWKPTSAASTGTLAHHGVSPGWRYRAPEGSGVFGAWAGVLDWALLVRHDFNRGFSCPSTRRNWPATSA